MSLTNRFSNRILHVGNSLLWEFFDLAINTENVISLSVGEPDFATPWHIREEGIYAIEKGRTYYTPTRGLLQLRQGISRYYERRFDCHAISIDEILVTVGASEGIDLVCRTFLNQGDECIIVDPGYIAYEPSVLLCEAIPVRLMLKEENKFKVIAEELEKVITDKTKMIIMNYPSNPTGGIMNRQDYQKILPLLKKHNIVVVVDEIYAELTYDEAPFSLIEIPELKEQTVILNGFSKTYAMTGWRIGYVIASSEVITAMNKIHQFSTMGTATLSQFAAIEAVSPRSDVDIERHLQSFKYRRNWITEQLNRIGLPTPKPEGAFYVFVNIKSTGLSSYEFCVRLLKEKKVCVIPGTAFGQSGEGFVRISYAYALADMKVALERIEEFVKEIKSK